MATRAPLELRPLNVQYSSKAAGDGVLCAVQALVDARVGGQKAFEETVDGATARAGRLRFLDLPQGREAARERLGALRQPPEHNAGEHVGFALEVAAIVEQREAEADHPRYSDTLDRSVFWSSETPPRGCFRRRVWLPAPQRLDSCGGTRRARLRGPVSP